MYQNIPKTIQRNIPKSSKLSPAGGVSFPVVSQAEWRVEAWGTTNI